MLASPVEKGIGMAASSEREGDLGAREVQVDADEAWVSERAEHVEEILAAADERDERAAVRDEAADVREQAASLAASLRDPQYVASLKARRAAANDRSQSKSDRFEGALDRSKLSNRPSVPEFRG